MICPLLTMTVIATPMGVKVLAETKDIGIDCVKEKCAWWIKTEQRDANGRLTNVAQQCAIAKLAKK